MFQLKNNFTEDVVRKYPEIIDLLMHKNKEFDDEAKRIANEKV